MIGLSYENVIICDFKTSCISFTHREFFDMLLDYFLILKNIVSEDLKPIVENIISNLSQLASGVR